MQASRFIAVGENIHCSRIYKVGGKFVKELEGGGYGILYGSGAEGQSLPIPELFVQHADWEAGKVKHCAVAIWQGTSGDQEDRAAGVGYIKCLAERQQGAGATYLDINIDEFSTDVEERMQLMGWTVGMVQEAATVPISVDSSNIDILRAGLQACDSARFRPMVNSVSLERTDAIEVAAEANAVVIASAAGAEGLPSNTEERLANLEELMPKLKEAGFAPADVHVDPLVFPISVDGRNGTAFLDAVRAVREKYGGEIHIVAGLSNVSFGMPNRKLINQVFTHLAVEAGADGGIVDPIQINADILNSLDLESEGFRLAKALLMGEDEFGTEFITAAREGRI